MEEIAKSEKNRITELDFARGVAILCVVAVHYFYMGEGLGVLDFMWTPFFGAVRKYGGAFFVLLSGVCVTLGSKSVKRGAIVFTFAMCLTAVTVWLYKSGREEETVLIQWGVLHCIGMCMMLWPLLKKLGIRSRLCLGAILTALGYYLQVMVHVRNPWLFPLGLRTWHFSSFDYFPMLPHLGWFLLGSGLGSLVYGDRKPLIPFLKPEFFAFCGRHSLAIYLAHLPLLYLYFRQGGSL